jgi:hypothetical protein
MNLLKKTVIIILLPIVISAQQTSKITIKNGNNNAIEINQSGKDSLQKSDLDIIKGDSNKVKIRQAVSENKIVKETSNFKIILEYGYYIAGILVAIIAVLQFLKYSQNKRKR